MPWTWDPRTLRYRDTDTGRFVRRADALAWSWRSIQASSNVTATLAGYAAEGSLSAADWMTMMRDEIKLEHIRQYTLGIGGREQMTFSDWGKVGSQIKEQYTYLRGFADEVAAGTLTEAEIANRISMYVNSAREAYETANGKAQVKAGMTEVLWVLNPALENCIGCQEFADMGWTIIEEDAYGGAVPGSGDTPCLTKCGCHEEYR